MRFARRFVYLAVLGAAVAGCDVAPSRTILPRQCLPIGGDLETTRVSIRAPADGLVRVAVEPRGIAIVASLPTPSGVPLRATSPVDRLGLITLVSAASAGESIVVRLDSRDWSEIRAEACVEAVLLSRADVRRTRAERAFSRAAAATYARDWQQAFDSYDAAATGFTRLGLAEAAGAARHAMAELAYQRLHKEGDAIALADEALNSYERHASATVRGTLTALKARALVEVHDLSAAGQRQAVQATIQAARNLLAESHTGSREAMRLTVLEGFLAYRIDIPQRAEQLFRQAMQECAAANDWECHGIAAQNVALLAEERESFAVALTTFEEAQRHIDADVAPELAADLLDNLGRLQRVAGLVAASDESHASALRLYARLDDCDGVRRTLARIGALHAQVGSIDDSIFELHRAASLQCNELVESLVGDQKTHALSQASSGACIGLLAPEELSTDGKLAVLQAVLTLEHISLSTGDASAAQGCVTKAPLYASTSRGLVRASNAHGELLLEQRQPSKARSAFEEAQRIADAANLPATHEHRGRTFLGLARASLHAGDEGAAQDLALQALRAGIARADIAQTVESLRVLAEAFRMRGELESASRTLHFAAELIERVPIDELNADVRATYLAAQHAAFAELTELLASTARDQAAIWVAYGVAERGRARSFRYALSQTETQRRSGDFGSAGWSPNEALRRVSAVFGDVSEGGVASVIRRLSAQDATPAHSLAVLESGPLQRRLARLDAALVQYASGRESMFAFVLDAGQLHVVSLGKQDEISALALQLAERLRDGTAAGASIAPIARELAQRAWWPVAQLIGRKRILVAPDGALHLVPFAILPWSAEAVGELVVDRAETAMVPSARFVARSTQTPRTSDWPRGLTLIGDPVFRRSRWQQECNRDHARKDPAFLAASKHDTWTEWLPSLPASRTEVLGIAELASREESQRRVETLLRCQATPANLRRAASGATSVLHIATHGRIDARRPRLSALALTPDAGAPHGSTFGLLDILGLELAARLVTLSACDTSRGRLLPGEGVLGPAQAFLQAGAASVVASYWRVSDETTARFMNAFYKRLLDQNMSAGEALRLTQLEEQSSDTSYSWAAFGLYGRPDTRI